MQHQRGGADPGADREGVARRRRARGELARQDQRPVRRLLPVRVRRLAREHADPRRQGAVGALQRDRGAQQGGAARHPRGRREEPGQRRQREEARRLLRVVHGRADHRVGGHRADQAAPRQDDEGQGRQVVDRGADRAARRRRRASCSRRRPGRTSRGRRRTSRSSTPPASACPTATITSTTSTRTSSPRTTTTSAGCSRSSAWLRRQRRRRRRRDRDRDGEDDEERDRAARRRQALQPDRRRQAREDRLDRRLEVVLEGGRHRRHEDDRRRHAGLLRRARQAAREVQVAAVERVLHVPPRAGRGVRAAEGVRRRGVRVREGDERRREAAGPLEALRRRDDRRARRAARPAYVAKQFPPQAKQTATILVDGDRQGDRRGDRRARLDVGGDQVDRGRQARTRSCG